MKSRLSPLKALVLSALMASSLSCYAQDSTGKIMGIYFWPDGKVSVELDSPLVGPSPCGLQQPYFWIDSSLSANKGILAALLLASAQERRITLHTTGGAGVCGTGEMAGYHRIWMAQFVTP